MGGEIFCCLFNQSYISNCRTLIRYLSQYQTDWDGISHAFMHSLTGREDRFRAYISAALTIALGFWKFVLRRAQNQCHALTGKQGFGSQKTICVSLKERKKKKRPSVECDPFISFAGDHVATCTSFIILSPIMQLLIRTLRSPDRDPGGGFDPIRCADSGGGGGNHYPGKI